MHDPEVAALVYIAAFAADRDESVETLIQNPPAGAPVPPILRPARISVAGSHEVRGGFCC
jgi:hypothetical protein